MLKVKRKIIKSVDIAPYECNMCSKKFIYKVNLNRHFSKRHTEAIKEESDSKHLFICGTSGDESEEPNLLQESTQLNSSACGLQTASDGNIVSALETPTFMLSDGLFMTEPEEGSEEVPIATGDSQLLHRYLYDATFNSSEGTTEPQPALYGEEIEELGINPEKIGVKYEDCDFNSSDSFASRETIVEKNKGCHLCPKKFMFNSELQHHVKHKHPIQHSCDECPMGFKSAFSLKVHQYREHNKPNPVVKKRRKKSKREKNNRLA